MLVVFYDFVRQSDTRLTLSFLLSHKAIRKGHAKRRYKRFLRIYPSTKTIYWSAVDPGASNVHELSAKSGG